MSPTTSTLSAAAAVEAMGIDPVRAILEIARAHNIAVAYETRDTIDPDGELTDEQWEAVVPDLDCFDEWLANSSAGEAIDVWRFGLVDEALHPAPAAA